MLKLRILLVSNYFYLLLIIFIITFILFTNYNIQKMHPKNNVTGIITSITIKDKIMTLTVKQKSKYLIKYYLNNKSKQDIINKYRIGMKVQVRGAQANISLTNNINSFNYQLYLLSIDVKYVINATTIDIIDNKFNVYTVKQHLINYLKKLPNFVYLNAMILADQSGISDEVANSYQVNGISHLLAISGAQIAIFVAILSLLLNKLMITQRFFIIISLLMVYGFLTGAPPSINRGIIAYLILSLNKIFDFHISNIKLFILTFFITLTLNPYIIHNVGFWYSYVITAALIIYQPNMSKNKIKAACQISVLSFLASIPITINSFYQINILGIIYNLFFVPLVSVIIYPGLLLSCLFPIMGFLITPVIKLMESLSMMLAIIDWLLIKSGKLNINLILFYYLLLFILIKKQHIKYIWFCLPFILYLNSWLLKPLSPTVHFIDVGQGDSILIQNNNMNILIDTGGKLSFNNERKPKERKIVINFLASIGIFKIDYLILTHGDADHIGDAINLVKSSNVKKVIFNHGTYNDLEVKLINVLENKNIPYYQSIKTLNIGKNKLFFLNTKEYNDENNNSIVIYAKINKVKMLFMGDAGIEKEKDILNKYKLTNIDILKIGHHGSKTSSSKNFIDEINPKYSIISVGNNNRYGHPSDSVLDNLDDYKIYRTDQDGSVKFKIKNKKLLIETCLR